MSILTGYCLAASSAEAYKLLQTCNWVRVTFSQGISKPTEEAIVDG